MRFTISARHAQTGQKYTTSGNCEQYTPEEVEAMEDELRGCGYVHVVTELEIV